MLERLGYKVVGAYGPNQAIETAAKKKEDIHLLITDVVMPDMNGRELAEKLRSFYPHIKQLFMSGYTANVIAHHGVLDEHTHFIQKPFSKADLANKVRKVLDSE
jgi:YesN/AraC family two-component response regulator